MTDRPPATMTGVEIRQQIDRFVANTEGGFVFNSSFKFFKLETDSWHADNSEDSISFLLISRARDF